MENFTKEDIEVMQAIVNGSPFYTTAALSAWNRIKLHCEEALKTSHNRQITPVVKCDCGEEAEIYLCTDCWKNNQ